MNYDKIIETGCYFEEVAKGKANYQEDSIVITNLKEAILLFDDFKYAKVETCLNECIKYIEINGVRFKRIEDNE